MIEYASKGYFVGDEIKELECDVGDAPSEFASASGSAPAGPRMKFRRQPQHPAHSLSILMRSDDD